MYNVTKVVHFRTAAGAEERQALTCELREVATGANHHLVAPTLSGVINGGDLIVHLQYSDRENWQRHRSSVESVLGATEVDKVYGVEYPSGVTERAVGAPRASVYRTLLLRVHPTADDDAIDRFERDLLSMPKHISSIRAWRLSRVLESTGPVEWTHVWEQEFTGHSAVTGQYLDHPVHWAVVDRWFDPECIEVVVRDRVCHTFCELENSVLHPQLQCAAPAKRPAAEAS
ncbi:stress responsive alpha/beta barrel protein [Rhodococcus sp. OK519]|uniref:Dabb family protein n=1 Tax=Rhodococcus sp. OK519 TaxID=2135729 RepID=UPI000D33A0A8|nr:stress responsive alpha/beta barrel protein [Rhodococcus sp. OK519]